MVDKKGLKTQWVIYHDPEDFPGQVMARMWYVGKGQLYATDVYFVVELVPGQDVRHWTSEELASYKVENARAEINKRTPGLICIPRHEDDEPQIVELWS